jgi:LacI family transcriptional regulator
LHQLSQSPSPLILFDMDTVNPWVPGIYHGFVNSVEALDWDVRLTRYRGKTLLDAESLFQQKKTHPAGMLTHSNAMATVARTQQVPLVFYGIHASPEIRLDTPCVYSDYVHMGRLAAETLLDVGYPLLTVIDLEKNDLVPHEKRRGFLSTLAEAKETKRLIQPPLFYGENGWMDTPSFTALCEWLSSIDRPLGIAAASVSLAWTVSRALRRTGIAVPEKAGLIAMGEDPILLGQARPQVSGIEENGALTGELLARFLAARLHGESVPLITMVPALGRIERTSTEMFRTTDPIVDRALKVIRANIEELAGVEDLARQCYVSRATLLRRFQKYRGRSPSEEIRRERLRQALDLIEHSELSFTEIANVSGYGAQSSLNRAVREAVGQPPRYVRFRSKGA